MEEYMNQLSCIPFLDELDCYVKFAEEYQAAFEYNEFYVPAIMDDPASIQNIIKRYKSTGRDCSKDTLHGAFFDVCINSGDPKIFKVSDYRVHQSMEIAQQIGVKAVIFHTNYIVNFKLKSYLNTWLNLNEIYWRKILEEYPDQKIYIENMFDEAPRMLTQLAFKMQDEPRFGVCFDLAHAKISGTPIADWFDCLSPYIVHMHINDNDGVEDSHCPVGTGVLDWKQFSQFGKQLKQEPSILIEVRNFKDLQQSVQYMKQNKIYPFHG